MKSNPLARYYKIFCYANIIISFLSNLALFKGYWDAYSLL